MKGLSNKDLPCSLPKKGPGLNCPFSSNDRLMSLDYKRVPICWGTSF